MEDLVRHGLIIAAAKIKKQLRLRKKEDVVPMNIISSVRHFTAITLEISTESDRSKA